MKHKRDDIKLSLKCFSCGRLIETLPIQCGYSITKNNETNQWECSMEDCGTISFDKFLCENCCTNKKIMKINKTIEGLSVENEEFNEELGLIKRQVVQTNFYNSDLDTPIKDFFRKVIPNRI